jgi:hypothetical protein
MRNVRFTFNQIRRFTMAKAKAAAAETTNETTTENSAPVEKAPKAPKAVNMKYVFQKDLAEGQKFAPQALLIVKHVQNAGGEGITRKALCEALTADPDFKTKQPVERIVSYYQKDLENAGILSVVKG